MTKREAEHYIRSFSEESGPESYSEAAELFRAIFDREPDDEDGSASELFSHCCAAVV